MPWRCPMLCLPMLMLAMIGLAGPGLAGARPATPPARRPNVVFILADDLGYGDVGVYGQKQIRTPHLDRLAAQGMRFTQFYAGAPVCAPSRCVLMTGRNVGRAYIRGNAKTNLRPEDVTVAEVLKGAGYTTGLFGKWGLGHEGSTGVPTRQGFDEFFGYLDQTHAHNYYPTFLLRNETRVPLPNVVPDEGPVGQGVASEKRQYSADLITAEALAFIDRHRERPFFLYYAPTLPHSNNEANRATGLGNEVPDLGAYRDRDWSAGNKAFAAMVARLDADVGRLLERLEQRGLAEQTIVIFSSDNGPHQEGGNDPAFFDSNGPLRGIKRDLYEGGIRVPLIARWPGHIRAGAVASHIGYFGDLMATAAAIAGTAPPKEIESVSFLPTLLGRPEQQQRHPFLYWEFYERGSSQAVRKDRWKAVRKPMLTGTIELYDLNADLGEARDVAAQHADVVAELRAVMDKSHVPSPLWKVPAP